MEEVCRKAREQKVYGVCVASSRVELAASLLEDSDLKLTALVGTSGNEDGDVKRYETEIAIDYGAQEIEVCLNVGRLKDGDRKYVLRELRDVAEAADERIVKVEIRPRLLTRGRTSARLRSGSRFRRSFRFCQIYYRAKPRRHQSLSRSRRPKIRRQSRRRGDGYQNRPRPNRRRRHSPQRRQRRLSSLAIGQASACLHLALAREFIRV